MATEPANAKVHHARRLATLELLCQKRGTCLHGLGGRRQDNIDKTALFYVMDRITTTRFLVHTGAACLVIPQTIAGCGTSSHSSVQGNTFLPTIGGGRLITSGLFSTKLDLGFSRLFSFTFHVSSQLNYGILGANFLAYHQLCVNVASQRLIENLKVQRSSPEDSSSLPAKYGISSGDTSQVQLVNTLRDEFSNVFEGDKRLRCIRHSVITDVHILTETAISLSARRLNPEQYQALKVEFKRFIDQGVLERNQSPWTSPIVMVKKNPEVGACVQILHNLTNCSKFKNMHYQILTTLLQ